MLGLDFEKPPEANLDHQPKLNDCQLAVGVRQIACRGQSSRYAILRIDHGWRGRALRNDHEAKAPVRMRLHDFAQLADLHRGLRPLFRLEFNDVTESAKLERKIGLICSTQGFSAAFWVRL